MGLSPEKQKNFKTTIASIIKSLSVVVGFLGYAIPSEVEESVIIGSLAIYIIFDFIQGYFTKDADEEE